MQVNTAGSWARFSDSRCPHCAQHSVLARIETLSEAQAAIAAWFAYREVEQPVSLEALAVTIATGLTVEFRRGNGYKSIEPTLVASLGELLAAAVEECSASDDWMIVSKVLSNDGVRQCLVGRRGDFESVINTEIGQLTEAVAALPRGFHALDDDTQIRLDALRGMCEQVGRTTDDVDALIAPLHRTQSAEMQGRSMLMEGETRAKRAVAINNVKSFSLGLLAIAGGFWLIDIVWTIYENRELLTGWLEQGDRSGWRPVDYWKARPSELAAPLQWAVVLVCVFGLAIMYFAVQVPLVYFLLAAGLLLSFLVYKSLVLLVAGLAVLGIGVGVLYYWYQRN